MTTTKDAHTLQPLVAVMFIDKDIVYSYRVRKPKLISGGVISESELFWVSLGG
jgi:methyl coenzyme M reductase alpha subunit